MEFDVLAMSTQVASFSCTGFLTVSTSPQHNIIIKMMYAEYLEAGRRPRCIISLFVASQGGSAYT